MANILIYDTITLRVKEYKESVNTPDYFNRNDVLINPVLPLNVLLKHIIIDNNIPRVMTQAEKDSVIAEETQIQNNTETARLANIDTNITNVNLTDFSMVKIDTIIDNIANLNDAKQFLKKLVRYIAKGGTSI